jgi:hypothetical protein
MNATSKGRRIEVPVSSLGWKEKRIVQNCLTGEKYSVSGGKILLGLPGWGGVWIG